MKDIMFSEETFALRDIRTSSHKYSGDSRNPYEENHKLNRKRKHSVTDKEIKASKRACLDLKISANEDLDFPSDLQNEIDNVCRTKQYIPHHLIELMYQLDVSVLCSLRKFTHEQNYPSLSLTFGDAKIDKFGDIVLYYKTKYIHVQIKYVNKHYTDNDISYAKLFTKEKSSFSINCYFVSFVKYVLSTSDDMSDDIECLIIYSNAGLGLTKEMKLRKRRSRNFYPFKFDKMNMKKFEILKDFLFTKDNMQESGFYQFSQDATTREQLIKHLDFPSALRKVINERRLSQEFEKGVKEDFIDKLVFAVDQPNREELNSIVKIEVEKNKVQEGYVALQERILWNLTIPEKQNKAVKYIYEIMYEFKLLMVFLHDLFLQKNMLSINFEGQNSDIFNDITINNKDKNTYIRSLNLNSNIDYDYLFPTSRQQNNRFSLAKIFALLVEKLEDIEYFIIYTNANLDIREKKELKKGQSKKLNPIIFDRVDIQKKKYKILRDCSCINQNGLFQFAQEGAIRNELLSKLKLFPSLQKEKGGRLFNENEKQLKEIFLDKLVFAVNQPNKEEFNGIIRNEIGKSNVPYNFEELHEIALRWSESYEVGPITKGIIEKILRDIKNNRSSYQEIHNANIDEEIKFAKSVVGREGTSAFDQFLTFLIKGEGKKYVEILKRERINLASVSSILDRAKTNAIKAFKDLFNLWFDENGNKTHYLKILEERRIKLANMSSILSGAGSNAAIAFQNLYDLWFNEKVNKISYLKILEREGISLANMSSMLSRAGANAAKAFKDLYDLWFDENGYKTHCLRTLEGEGISLTNMSSMLSRAGSNAAKAFKKLYDLWFDKQGNKTLYLKSLESEGINLTNMSSILNGSRTNAAEAFKDLYNIWFDEAGNQTCYLKSLEREGISLINISGILSKAGSNAAKTFKDLYDLLFDAKRNITQYLKTLKRGGVNLANMSSILNGAGSSATKALKDLYILWFDKKGNKTLYLKTLEEKGIDLANVSSILNGAGSNAAEAFEDLYDLWFDEKGNKTRYLKTLEGEGISLINISSILSKAGSAAAKSFKDLYDLWFDKQEKKTHYLKTLEEKGIDLSNISSILHGVGANAVKAFKDLYDLWFNKQGNKTQYIKTLEGEEVNLTNISSILHGAGSNAAKAFKDLFDLWFDKHGNKTQYLKTLEIEGIDLANISSILHGVGTNGVKAFKGLYDLWFDKQGNKTHYLTTLKGKKTNLTNMSSILNGAGANAVKAFKDMYDLWFDKQGNKTHYLKTLEGEGLNLTNMSSILSGAGANAVKAFKDLFKIWFDNEGKKTKHLKHFFKKKNVEKSFTPHNLSGILSGAGSNAKIAFEKLHSVCFNDKGKRTQLLNDFFNADFEPSHLSCMLCGAGARASSILTRWHIVCFDDKGERTKLLNDFYDVGFKPGNLCDILSGAADNLEKFHDFCFIGETKKYLNHFVNEKKGFTISNLSQILHGARGNICSAFKDFHDVCFHEAGNKTQFLDDFHKVGLKSRYLANILSMAGNNASSNLKNFYKSCFNKDNYLNHFLCEKELFTPKNLSKLLDRIGLNICPTFEKLHYLCFNETGTRTNYLNNLIKSNSPDEIFIILYKKVRKAPSSFLDEQNVLKIKKTINANMTQVACMARNQ